NSIAEAISSFLDARVQDTRAATVVSRTPEAYLALYQAHAAVLWYPSGTPAAPQETRREVPLYREIAFVGPDGRERLRVENGRLVPADQLRDVSRPANTTY